MVQILGCNGRVDPIGRVGRFLKEAMYPSEQMDCKVHNRPKIVGVVKFLILYTMLPEVHLL